MKHTPGPWFVQDAIGEIAIRSETKPYVALVLGSEFMDVSARLANAKLLAAAPDLLHALNLLTNPLFMSRFGDMSQHTFVETALAAIAKATGD